MAQLYTLNTSRKSEPDMDPIARHIEDWQRVSRDHKAEKLGQDWFWTVETFYNLVDSGGPLPSFRPLIRVPELQILMNLEANDLSETVPRPYIVDTDRSSRDQLRERALQAEWKRAQVNYHAMFTALQSLYTGMCPLQIGFNPEARNGRGAIWAKMRDPRTFDCDPFTDYELKWSYVILEDKMQYEEVRRRWPLTSAGIKPRIAGRSVSPAIGDAAYGFQLPPGPMGNVPGMSAERTLPHDNRLRVRWVYCLDYTREKIEDKTLPSGAIVPADFEWKYPNGRLIVECEGRILQDGDNPYPMRMFPTIPFWSTMPLYGVWATPAIKYTMGLQSVAERLYTQLFENAVRLNNGVWFIDKRTGIDPEAFGGLPGEVQVINSNAPIPQVQYGTPMPPQYTQLPQLLLDKQKGLQGFTPARQGQPGDGNISPELYDESILRSQGMTQLRGRLNAISYQRAAELIFYTMAKFYGRQTLSSLGGDTGFETVQWAPVPRPDLYDVYLDPGSIMPMSQTAMRRLAPQMLQGNILDSRSFLEVMDWPNAAEVADRKNRELELQALAATKGKRR